MDRLKPDQNGLIFTFESTLRIDAYESIAAMTPIRKKRCPKKRAVVRAVAGEEREPFSPYGAGVVPVWRCYTEVDSKGDQLYEVKG